MIILKGAYFLLIFNSKIFEKNVGKSFRFVFPIGYYTYIGSAMGDSSTSLGNRLKRHVKTCSMKNQSHRYWHIDYFLTEKSVKIYQIFILPNSTDKEECDISGMLNVHCDKFFEGFGCSDCQCTSHLYYFNEDNPYLEKLLQF